MLFEIALNILFLLLLLSLLVLQCLIGQIFELEELKFEFVLELVFEFFSSDSSSVLLTSKHFSLNSFNFSFSTLLMYSHFLMYSSFILYKPNFFLFFFKFKLSIMSSTLLLSENLFFFAYNNNYFFLNDLRKYLSSLIV